MCFVKFYVSKNAGELAENSILFLMFTYFKSQLINKFIFSHSLSYFDRFRDRIIMKSCVKCFLSDIYKAQYPFDRVVVMILWQSKPPLMSIG